MQTKILSGYLFLCLLLEVGCSKKDMQDIFHLSNITLNIQDESVKEKGILNLPK